MRRAALLIFVIGSSAIGCAQRAETGSTMIQTDSAPPLPAQPYYAPRAAAALAFDPPILDGAPLPSLSRVGRSPAAFAGYEETRVEYHQLYQRDQQNTDRGDRLDRQAYTVRSSTTFR